MDPDLLRTKLYRPRPGDELIPRPRLQALFQGAGQTPATLVSAPAGCGKSVAVAQWVESLPIAFVVAVRPDDAASAPSSLGPPTRVCGYRWCTTPGAMIAWRP